MRIRPPIDPPGGRKKISNKTMKPYCSSMGRQRQATCGGRKANSTFDPSRGGSGRG